MEVFKWGRAYEDLPWLIGSFFVLRSKGIVERFKFATPDSVSNSIFQIK